jgi:hypothetical protein
MRKTALFLLAVLFVISGCTPSSTRAEPTITPSPTITDMPSVTSVPTLTPLPTLSPSVLRLRPGEAVLHPATETNPYAFYSYFPKSAVREREIAIGVWSESVDRFFDDYEYCIERAKEYAASLSVYSERYRVSIVVMAIPGDEKLAAATLHPDTFSNLDSELSRPDLKLIDAVWNQYIPSLKEAGFVTNDRVLMLGDQGSGAFPHRFAILHPELVQAFWESSGAPAPLPADELNGTPLDYPLGTRNLEELTGKPFDLEAYLEVHQLISVGEDDDVGLIIPEFFPNEQWQFIKAHFGKTDTERAEFFYRYLISIGAPAEFKLYKGVRNRLTDEMMNDGFEFLAAHSRP